VGGTLVLCPKSLIALASTVRARLEPDRAHGLLRRVHEPAPGSPHHGCIGGPMARRLWRPPGLRRLGRRGGGGRGRRPHHPGGGAVGSDAHRDAGPRESGPPPQLACTGSVKNPPPPRSPNAEPIPDFGAKPTISSAKSGAWSDASIWSTGTLPATGDVAVIAA